MNKKRVVICMLIIWLAGSAAGFAENQKQESSRTERAVVKTYFLKNVSPVEVHRTLDAYFWKISYEKNRSVITVTIPADNLKDFENMLKKIDVPRKMVEFEIYTVIASTSQGKKNLENSELNRVVKKLSGVLSFKSYRLDGVSLLRVREGAEYARIMLNSTLPDIELRIDSVKVGSGPVARAEVDIAHLHLAMNKKTLLKTGSSIRNSGYLVAGVSSLGKGGDALMLIIRPRIME